MRRTVLLLLARASCVGGAFAGITLYDKHKWSRGNYPDLVPSYGYDDDKDDRLWQHAVIETYDLRRITADHCGAFAGFSRIDQCAGFVVCEFCVGARLQSASWRFRKGWRVACWKKVERCFFAEAEERGSGAFLHCALKFYVIPSGEVEKYLSGLLKFDDTCYSFDSGFYDLQERLALEFYKAAVGVDERIKRQVVAGHRDHFIRHGVLETAYWCGGDALYTGAPATIPDRRRQWHEGPAGGILMVQSYLALLCLCGEIQRHFDRRRRRRPRTAPQDDDDSEGDFEPGPRATTASARRRSPRLARR